MMMEKRTIQMKPNKHLRDERRLIQFRALTPEEKPEEQKDEMIVEGKAISYNDKTVLFKWDGIEYYEIVEKGCLDNADLSDVFMKYNHTDNIMVMARTRSKTLEIIDKEDGAYIRANLANTSAGRDLYELIRRGDIDKMSFAFTERTTTFNESERTWIVNDIEKMYDVAAVPVPAYDDTEIYARRKDVLEKRQTELESLKRARLRVKILNQTK